MSGETRFTPGPWWMPKDSPCTINSDPHNIAIANFVNGKANANLIAAAPDLYEALEAVVREFGDSKYPEWTDAIAALARARGEQPLASLPAERGK